MELAEFMHADSVTVGKEVRSPTVAAHRARTKQMPSHKWQPNASRNNVSGSAGRVISREDALRALGQALHDRRKPLAIPPYPPATTMLFFLSAQPSSNARRTS